MVDALLVCVYCLNCCNDHVIGEFKSVCFFMTFYVVNVHRNIDRHSLQGLRNFEIDGLDCHVITTEYIARVIE